MLIRVRFKGTGYRAMYSSTHYKSGPIYIFDLQITLGGELTLAIADIDNKPDTLHFDSLADLLIRAKVFPRTVILKHPVKHLLITGAQGSGKTTLANTISTNLHPIYYGVFDDGNIPDIATLLSLSTCGIRVIVTSQTPVSPNASHIRRFNGIEL